MKLPFVLRSTYEDEVERHAATADTLTRCRKKIHRESADNHRLKGQVAGLKLEVSRHKRKRDDNGRYIKKHG